MAKPLSTWKSRPSAGPAGGFCLGWGQWSPSREAGVNRVSPQGRAPEDPPDHRGRVDDRRRGGVVVRLRARPDVPGAFDAVVLERAGPVAAEPLLRDDTLHRRPGH